MQVASDNIGFEERKPNSNVGMEMGRLLDLEVKVDSGEIDINHSWR